MNQCPCLSQKHWGMFSTLLGSLLIGLPIIPLPASAMPSSMQNPCPGIYYEEPHNSTRLVPKGCPPNSATQILIEQGRISGDQYDQSGSVNVLQPPLPETRQPAIATITPAAGKVDVRLKNDTNAQIWYQAVGYTERRVLTGENEVVLRNLPTPVTITMVRQDGGLLKVMPMSNSQSGVLSISLDETTNLNGNRGALRIQRDGQVFLN